MLRAIFAFIALNSSIGLAGDRVDDEKAAPEERVALITITDEDLSSILQQLEHMQEELKKHSGEAEPIGEAKKPPSKLCRILGKMSLLAFPSGLLSAAGVFEFNTPHCWRFTCSHLSNATHLIASSKECADAFVSKSCALLGAHCQNALGAMINATAVWDKSCQSKYRSHAMGPFIGGCALLALCCIIALDCNLSEGSEEILHKGKNQVPGQSVANIEEALTAKKKQVAELLLNNPLGLPVKVMKIIFEYEPPKFADGSEIFERLEAPATQAELPE